MAEEFFVFHLVPHDIFGLGRFFFRFFLVIFVITYVKKTLNLDRYG